MRTRRITSQQEVAQLLANTTSVEDVKVIMALYEELRRYRNLSDEYRSRRRRALEKQVRNLQIFDTQEETDPQEEEMINELMEKINP